MTYRTNLQNLTDSVKNDYLSYMHCSTSICTSYYTYANTVKPVYGSFDRKRIFGVISGNLHVYAPNYTLVFTTFWQRMLVEITIIACHVIFLKPTHVQTTTLRNKSTSHPHDINCNNCLSKHIHFLTLFKLVFYSQIRHKTFGWSPWCRTTLAITVPRSN